MYKYNITNQKGVCRVDVCEHWTTYKMCLGHGSKMNWVQGFKTGLGEEGTRR